MNKIFKLLTSRTFWVIVLMFLVGGTHAITQFLPSALVMPLEGVLGLLASYLHVNPSQEY